MIGREGKCPIVQAWTIRPVLNLVASPTNWINSTHKDMGRLAYPIHMGKLILKVNHINLVNFKYFIYGFHDKGELLT